MGAPLSEEAADSDGAMTPPAVRAAAWRRRLGIGIASLEGTAEANEAGDPDDRIALARETMRQVVRDRLGGDAALLVAVDELAISSKDAIALLEDDAKPPEAEQFSALEAVVAFDGSRPSFLLKEDRIDFESSYNTDKWQVQLGPYLDELREFAACVARVELGTKHIGTAFLVAPTLALTNRHVAQAIADLGVDPPVLFDAAFLDFGREQAPGRDSHDRREIKRVVLAGIREIVEGMPVDHTKLDLALVEVAPSTLAGPSRDRYLPLSARAGDVPSNWLIGSVGYPSNWHDYVPASLRTAYDDVLQRLLDGDAGTKRFAPGRTGGMVDSAPRWSATHDATTINGNSGSPVAQLRSGTLKVTGLHYGGRWGGERTNWAHVLGNCGDGQCFPGNASLRDLLAQHGVTL